MLKLFDQMGTFQRSLLSAMARMLFYGAWAFYVNSAYGFSVAMKAGIIQGMNSFFLTFVMSIVMEQFFKCFSLALLRFLATFLSSSILVCLFSWTVNYLANTPEILMTILPGCIVSTVYAFSYTLALEKTQPAL